VKENVCEDGERGVPEKRLDPVDSSVTRLPFVRLHYLLGFKRRHSRSDLYWKMIFCDAGLDLFHEGAGRITERLFTVKM
jgi:hypothetical protein